MKKNLCIYFPVSEFGLRIQIPHAKVTISRHGCLLQVAHL